MAVGDVAASPALAAGTGPELATAERVATLGNRWGRTLLAGFTAAHFSHHVSNSLLNPLLPFIRDSFALTYAQSGFLVSAFSLSLGLSNAPVGVLADRVGPRPVIVVGLIVTGAVSAALAFAGNYWQLLILMVLLGLIAGTYHAPAASLLTRAFPMKSRGAAIGLHITGGHLSFFAVPLVAAWMVTQADEWWRPYLWLAFAPVVTGVMIWYLAPKGHERPADRVDRLAVFRELGSVVRSIGPLVSASIVFQMCYAALLAFMTLFLVDARGIAPGWAVAIFGVPQLVGLVMAPLAGYLSDRLGRRTVILLGMGGLGPSLFALTLVPADLILLPLLAIGVTSSMRQTVTEVFVMDSAPPQQRATILGGYYMLTQELGGLAAPLLGFLAWAAGIEIAYTGSSAVVAALSVAVLLLGRKL